MEESLGCYEEDLKAKCLLDNLYLHLLNLIEDEVMFHQELCQQTSRSRMVLARIRMQHGTQRTASEILVPVWPPYRALCRLFEDYTPWGAVVNLCRYPIATERGFLQPLTNIFGSLIPASLRVAKRHWDLSVEYSVECANMRKELLSTMSSIRKLRLRQSNRRQSSEL